MSADDDPGRSKRTGQFSKGHSGFAGRRKRPREPLLPHQLAAIALGTAIIPVRVKDHDGKTKLSTPYEVALRQIAVAAAQGDRPAGRLYITTINDAAKVAHAHQQRLFERLGAYLRSVDEGHPWPLDAAEANFYQDLADQAGIPIRIKTYDPARLAAQIRAEHIDAVLSTPTVDRLLGEVAHGGLSAHDQRAIVRRVLQAYVHVQPPGHQP